MIPPTINLDALHAFDSLVTAGSAGKVMMLETALIHEDPDQPRKTFDDVKQRDLCASIEESGIRVPISVRAHPSLPGQYMLNFGARRHRAAVVVGLPRMPALIEDMLSDFDQVIENLQRADLSPMEMALFIASKQRGGMKPAEIARRLGLTRPAVSKFFALVDAPSEIEAVYTGGRTTSPDTIYDLRLVFDRWPAETTAWLATDVEVTRRTIGHLKQTLLDVPPVSRPSKEISQKVLLKRHETIRRPVLLVVVGSRPGMLVLDRHHYVTDEFLVRWADTGKIEAVSVSDIRLVRLEEGRRKSEGLGGRQKEPRR